MIKLIDVTPPQEYSCQFCNKTFQSDRNFRIERGIYPVCSPTCRLKVFEKVLGGYTNSQLKEALSIALPNFKPKIRALAINRLASFMLSKQGEGSYNA